MKLGPYKTNIVFKKPLLALMFDVGESLLNQTIIPTISLKRNSGICVRSPRFPIE